MLFTKIDELREHADFPRSIKFEKIKPFILVAENSHLKTALTSSLYTEIEAAYQASKSSSNPTALSANQAELWGKIAFALAHLAAYEAADHINVGLSDGGFTRHETENTKSAYEYQVRAYKANMLRTGFQGLDWLIEYLEANTGNFATYATAPERILRISLFLSSITDFDKHIKLTSSWVMMQLQPQIERAEKNRIKPLIGQTKYDEIKAELAAENLSAENRTLLDDIIKPAIAHLAFADGLVELRITVDEHGVSVRTSGTVAQKKEPANDTKTNELANHHRQLGEKYLEDLFQDQSDDDEKETHEANHFITESSSKASAFL